LSIAVPVISLTSAASLCDVDWLLLGEQVVGDQLEGWPAAILAHLALERSVKLGEAHSLIL
jgi:hypothetical protein